ncbi:MAG: hypothetical protein AAGF27_12110 [Pseudomonadota bacterium]
MIHGLARKLLDFGMAISDSFATMAVGVEDTGEALVPVFTIQAVDARWRQ